MRLYTIQDGSTAACHEERSLPLKTVVEKYDFTFSEVDRIASMTVGEHFFIDQYYICRDV